MVVCRRCGGAHWTLSCPFKDVAAADAARPGPGGAPAAGAAAPAGILASGGAGKYVAPRARDPTGAGGVLGGPERVIPLEELTQLRVSNLSEDADEDELRGLFQPFGRLDKIFLAKDRETGRPRGFAFVRYMRHDDAAAAMKAIDGLPYLHLILRVDWSKPSERGPGGVPGGVSKQHYSGYGKRLAQDIV
jgi:translation initiation factor 3 subunit G